MGLLGPYFLKHTYNFVKVSYSLSHQWDWQKIFLKTKQSIFKGLTLQYLEYMTIVRGRINMLTFILYWIITNCLSLLVVEKNATLKKYISTYRNTVVNVQKRSRVAEVLSSEGASKIPHWAAFKIKDFKD